MKGETQQHSISLPINSVRQESQALLSPIHDSTFIPQETLPAGWVPFPGASGLLSPAFLTQRPPPWF